jgi:hypothetical protein
MPSIGGASFFNYKANGQLRASKGAVYVAKAARVSGIVNTINTCPASKQRVEALRAALAQSDVRATALSAGFASTLEEGIMVVDAYFYNSLPRARNWWWTLAPSLTLVVPSHMVVYVGINLESTVGRAYRARATRGRQSQPAQCTCMMMCTQRPSRRVATREHDLVLVGDDCELTLTSDTAGPSGHWTRGRLRSVVTYTDGNASRLLRVRAVLGSERGSSEKRIDRENLAKPKVPPLLSWHTICPRDTKLGSHYYWKQLIC